MKIVLILLSLVMMASCEEPSANASGSPASSGPASSDNTVVNKIAAINVQTSEPVEYTIMIENLINGTYDIAHPVYIVGTTTQLSTNLEVEIKGACRVVVYKNATAHGATVTTKINGLVYKTMNLSSGAVWSDMYFF